MNKIDINNLVLVEGFSLTGKTSFIENKLPNYYSHYEITTQLLICRKEPAWLQIYAITNLLKSIIENSNKTNLSNLNIIFERGIFSAYVYSKIYNNKIFDNEILDYYKNNAFFKDDIEHIYIKHHSIETAKELFNNTEQSLLNTGFKTFEDYWKLYSIADLLYQEIYNYIGIKPIIFETIPDLTWEIFNKA